MSDEYLAPWLASNILALVLLFFCWKYKTIGRYGYGIVFLLASVTNVIAAINNPQDYLGYGPLILLKFYETFIYGFFAEHIKEIVLAIAFGQFLISFGLFFGRFLYKPAIVGGLIFSIAIIPLGMGSGFPVPILMVISFWLLFSEKQFKAPKSIIT
jgi:hypothetical protein